MKLTCYVQYNFSTFIAVFEIVKPKNVEYISELSYLNINHGLLNTNAIKKKEKKIVVKFLPC
jgi:hypothetical protein